MEIIVVSYDYDCTYKQDPSLIKNFVSREQPAEKLFFGTLMIIFEYAYG